MNSPRDQDETRLLRTNWNGLPTTVYTSAGRWTLFRISFPVAGSVGAKRYGQFCRYCHTMRVVNSINGIDVVEVIESLKRDSGLVPQRIQVENGSEFISQEFDKWAYENKVTLDYSRPGKPKNGKTSHVLTSYSRAIFM